MAEPALSHQSVPGLTWAISCGVLALGAGLAQALPAHSLDWQPSLALREPWRWWSAAFVHHSTLHLGANLAGCAVVGAFGWAARLPGRWLVAWLVAWPLTHLALAVQPGLLHYGGLSGVLHAGVAVAALAVALESTGSRCRVGWLVLAGLALKVLLEQPWGPPVRTVAGWDMGIAPLAHTSGALAGLLTAALTWGWSRRPGTGAA